MRQKVEQTLFYGDNFFDENMKNKQAIILPNYPLWFLIIVAETKTKWTISKI